jgi:hypothetical protein|eukprot:4012452-Prymnesium_polylepis.1
MLAAVPQEPAAMKEAQGGEGEPIRTRARHFRADEMTPCGRPNLRHRILKASKLLVDDPKLFALCLRHRRREV